MAHFMVKCSCGAVIAQCRCMCSDKAVRIVVRGCEACKAALQDTVGRTVVKVPVPHDGRPHPFGRQG